MHRISPVRDLVASLRYQYRRSPLHAFDSTIECNSDRYHSHDERNEGSKMGYGGKRGIGSMCVR